ncbi:MAG: hypothetical protein RLZZ303_3777 [Candidatus Hydrogenedentota bacterium]|jgi:hypothetical protein
MSAPHEVDTSSPLWRGVLAWVLIAIALVALRGVRWDENFEFAQVLAGRVIYDEGHPLPLYLSKALSLQPHLITEMLRLGCPELALNALRNVLYLCASVIPAFLFGAALGRQACWGHFAAVAVLQGWLLEFDGSYPHDPWPTLYSNGHVGTGWALLCLYLLVRRVWFWAILCCALMPALHVGQSLPLGILCAVWGGRAMLQGELHFRRHALPALALAALVWGWLLWRMQGISVAPPPAELSPQRDLYRIFVALHDPHRQLPGVLAHVAALLCLAQAALAWLIERDENARRLYGGVALYALLVCLLVYPIALLHAALGTERVSALLVWMPYRLINQLAPLWLAVSIGMLTRVQLGWLPLLAALALSTARPLLQVPLPAEWFTRYLFAGEAFPLLLAGAALAFHAARAWPAAIVPLVAFLMLAPLHQFGAACLAAGALLATACLFIEKSRAAMPTGQPVLLVSLLCTVALVSSASNQYRHWEHLPRSAADRHLRNVSVRAPLVAPPDTYALQARTGLSVLADAATASFVTYVPEAGPSIALLHERLYGMTFEAGAAGPPWQEVWSARGPEEWHSIAEETGARYLLAPGDLAVQLPVLEHFGDEAIYWMGSQPPPAPLSP